MGHGKRINWGIVGTALTALTFALAAANVSLPYDANLAIAIAAGAAILVALGGGRRLIDGASRQFRGVVRRQVEAGKREAILRSCDHVVALLMALLGAPEDFEERRWFDVSRMMRDRDLLARYRKTVRAPCRDALAAMTPTLTPPARVSAVAAEPQNVRDLHSLLVWFVTARDRLRSAPEEGIELLPNDSSRSPI
jgi:hypothetical protein